MPVVFVTKDDPVDIAAGSEKRIIVNKGSRISHCCGFQNLVSSGIKFHFPEIKFWWSVNNYGNRQEHPDIRKVFSAKDK